MAKQFAWRDEMNTGVDVIDDQHRQLVEMVNHLYAIEDPNNRKEIKTVLDDLVNYTLSHFAFEEGMMEEAGYPLTRPHKRVHELFVKRVTEFYQRFEKGEDVLIPLRQVLSRWLLNHIMHEDMAFSEIVKSYLSRKTQEVTHPVRKSFFARLFGK